MTETPRPDLSPLEILDLPIEPNESGAASVRGYLVALLSTLWREGECFDGKRPFGNSGWECDLYHPLVAAGLVRARPNGWGVVHDDDRRAADQLVREAIGALKPPSSVPELNAQADAAEAHAAVLERQVASLRAQADALRTVAGGAA